MNKSWAVVRAILLHTSHRLISCMVSWLLTILIYIPSINNAFDVISYLPFKMAYSSWVIRREKMKGGRGIHVTGRMTVM